MSYPLMLHGDDRGKIKGEAITKEDIRVPPGRKA